MKILIYGQDLGSGKIGFMNLQDIKIEGKVGKSLNTYLPFYQFQSRRTHYAKQADFEALPIPRIIQINPLLFKKYYFTIGNSYTMNSRYLPLTMLSFHTKNGNWGDTVAQYRFNKDMLEKSLINMPFKDGIYPINLGDALKLLHKGFKFLETTKENYECLSILEWV